MYLRRCRRKPLRGASFTENSSVFVHYLRDPREKAGCAAWDSLHPRKGPLATSDGRQWGFSCQSAPDAAVRVAPCQVSGPVPCVGRASVLTRGTVRGGQRGLRGSFHACVLMIRTQCRAVCAALVTVLTAGPITNVSLCGLTWPAVIGGPCRGSPRGRSSRSISLSVDHHGPSLTYTSATPTSRASPTRTSDHRWPC